MEKKRVIELDEDAANTLYFLLTDEEAMKKLDLSPRYAGDLERVWRALEEAWREQE